jgi:hypothetical protein
MAGDLGGWVSRWVRKVISIEKRLPVKEKMPVRGKWKTGRERFPGGRDFREGEAPAEP